MNNLINRLVLRNVRVPLREYTDAAQYDMCAITLAQKQISKIHLRYPVDKNSFAVFKKSVDARKKNEICFIYSVVFSLESEIMADDTKYKTFCDFCARNNIAVLCESALEFSYGSFPQKTRPVIAGFGPCGMFLALTLARAGFAPIVIERGSDVDKRTADVENYWKTGKLSTSSNVQFGEGGAGTFSDGKLMTRINDPLCTHVLETFYEHGANKDILFNAKPHVGTDKLRSIVKNIRESIISLGGEVRFDTCLTSIVKDGSGKVCAVKTDHGDIATDAVFLAIGHSARDTFRSLISEGIDISAKPFSVGVRIEHLQKNINRALYGEQYENPALPQGEYSLSKRFGDRAVYSFCMCPGGTVVASASENGTIVTNGMSYSSRNGTNANSAIAVSVNTADFGGTVDGAMDFQYKIEQAAFAAAGADGSAPVENLGHFLGRTTMDITDVLPTYTGGTAPCDIGSLFPEYISELLRCGIKSFESHISGFSADSAILTAPETRTSSPVRINRTEEFCSLSCEGLYPCGEGAGYAGGITSAAVDGIRCALSYISKYKPNIN